MRFEKPKTVKACSLQQIVWRPIPDIVEEEPLNLSALCICRQLYTEAALLPYALIKFVLVDKVLLPRFWDALLPIRKETVGKIMRRNRGVKGGYLGK